MRSIWSSIGLAALAAVAFGLGGASMAEAGDLENGKLAYTANCVACHGEKGDGKGPAAAAIQPPPRDFSTGQFVFDADGDGKTGSDADLAELIKKGAMAFGGSPLMTPWAHLPQKDIDDVIAYVRSLKRAPSVAAGPAAEAPGSSSTP